MIQQIVEGGGRTSSYSYDSLRRLAQETVLGTPNGGSVAYALDAVGNRLSQTSSLPGIASSTATYDRNDQTTGAAFDANGNLQSLGGLNLQYDAFDRLAQFSGTATSGNFVYNGVGAKVGKGTTSYLLDEQNPSGLPQVVEELAGGSVVRRYVQGIRRISVGSPSVPVQYFGYDGGGAVRQMMDASGAVTDTVDYDAFGNTISRTGNAAIPYLYRGEQFEPDLGAYYNRAGYCDPIGPLPYSRSPSGTCRRACRSTSLRVRVCQSGQQLRSDRNG